MIVIGWVLIQGRIQRHADGSVFRCEATGKGVRGNHVQLEKSGFENLGPFRAIAELSNKAALQETLDTMGTSRAICGITIVLALLALTLPHLQPTTGPSGRTCSLFAGHAVPVQTRQHGTSTASAIATVLELL